MNWKLICGMVALVACSPSATSGARRLETKVDPCGQSYTKVLARNRYAQLEFAADGEGTSGYRRSYQLTCAPSNRNSLVLDRSTGPSVLGEATSLNGRFVGYVVDQCENDEGPVCATRVIVFGSVNREDRRFSSRFTVARDPRRIGYKPVPSLRITSRGAVAFIVCLGGPDRTAGKIPDRCRRPGSRSRVYAYRSDSYTRRLLDRGRGIDPDSMRRTGDVIRWRHNGRWKRIHLR